MRSNTLARHRYSRELLVRVAEGWRRIADDRRRGVTGAARVAADLAALAAPPALLATAAHVIQDHLRHVEVCARVLEEIEPNAPDAASRMRIELALPRPSKVSESALAETLIASYALGKPISAAAFAGARAAIREPLFAWAYTELLHDEARHATFGAKAAAWVIRHWPARRRYALWTKCLTAPAGSLIGRADPEAESLGLLPAEVDCTLPRWILPHLEPLGVHPLPANHAVH
jgi:hypothetical protein